MLKPDCIQRGLVGDCIARFEKAGLKVVALKMVRCTKNIAEKHYPDTTEWLKAVGQKTLKTYAEYGLDAKADLGTDNDLEIGKIVKKWLVDFICTTPVICMVIEGNHAVDVVRKIIGNTIPLFAQSGTIRGDYSADSPDLANKKRRPVRNLIHASGDLEEAKREIALWFRDDEIYSIERADEQIMFG